MVKSLNYLKVLPVLTLFLLLAGCTFLFDSFDRSSYGPPPIPNEPRTYNAEYNKVWNSALDVLDEDGYVIAQMEKADGYITTERKGSNWYRSKVSLRIVRDGSKVTVKVNVYEEEREPESYYKGADGVRTYTSWSQRKSYGHSEKRIKDKIAEKLGLTQ